VSGAFLPTIRVVLRVDVAAVPISDESQWLRNLPLATDDMAKGSRGGRPVAVIVLQDGTELHFFQFIDSDDEESLDDDDDRCVVLCPDCAARFSPEVNWRYLNRAARYGDFVSRPGRNVHFIISEIFHSKSADLNNTNDDDDDDVDNNNASHNAR